MNPRHSFYPDPAQSALLRACLEEGDAAAAAFTEWRGTVDLDSIDAGSVRLLPLLATRIVAFGVEDGQIGRYRGVQRQAWAQNQVLLNQLRPALDALARADIRVMALKGIVLASSVYPNMSTRPMCDVDLLVDREHGCRTIELLETGGWRPLSRTPRTAADFAAAHAVTFVAPGDSMVQIDVHWRLFNWSTSRVGEEALWSRAVPLPILHPTVLAPGPADMLMHVCAHGARMNGLPPVRWVADATMLLRRGGVDWEHFTMQCNRFGVAAQAAATLDYLADEMMLPIPRVVRAQLDAATTTPIERLIFAIDQIPFEQRATFAELRLHLHRARSLMGGGPLGLLRYADRMRAGRSAGWIIRRLLRRRG